MKNHTKTTVPEHAAIEPVRKNLVKLTAEEGWLLKSKHTGKQSQSVITAHVAGYDVIEDEKEPNAE